MGDDERRPKLRLFVAVDPGETVEHAIGRAIGRLRRRAPDAKWVRPESMHVTLAFLGYVEADQVDAIGRALTDVAARHEALVLHARGGGAFGSGRRPRVLWTDLVGDVAKLAALQVDIETALLPFGYEPENRPFRAHLTLARARDRGGDAALADCVEALADADFGEMRIDQVVLYRSDLAPTGATYTPLVRAQLK